MMQELVGIVRVEDEMVRAVEALEPLKRRAERVGTPGNRDYNPGWHTAVDLRHLLMVSEAIARSALDRKESRGGHFRDDYPGKDPEGHTFNVTVRQGEDGEIVVDREAIPPMPAELRQVVEENQ
jgi:succinate dehydrogenase / fumarate reductase flavoprotein subunit